MQYKVVSHPVLYPEKTENKDKSIKVLDTPVNLEWLLRHFYADISFNLMTRRREIIIPNHYISSEDSENSALALVTYLSTINGMPIKNLDNHLDVLAWKNSYHPIIKCIVNKTWDGVPRLDKFIKLSMPKIPN